MMTFIEVLTFISSKVTNTFSSIFLLQSDQISNYFWEMVSTSNRMIENKIILSYRALNSYLQRLSVKNIL